MSYSVANLRNVVLKPINGYVDCPKVGDKVEITENIQEGNDNDGRSVRIVVITEAIKNSFGIELRYGKYLHEYPFLEKGAFVKIIEQ